MDFSRAIRQATLSRALLPPLSSLSHLLANRPDSPIIALLVAKTHDCLVNAEVVHRTPLLLLKGDPDIATYTAYVGRGVPRFWLGLDPQQPGFHDHHGCVAVPVGQVARV
jgi:hypothetical protein